MPSKATAYRELVRERKTCDACKEHGLTNPAQCARGAFDSSEIGPWTRWQGNLDAQIMVVGQDWGDVAAFKRQWGKDEANSQTNTALSGFLSDIGFPIPLPSESEVGGLLFFTNAVLCLKTGNGGSQANVKSKCFHNCGRFLKRQIEIVNPKLVICLGTWAYETMSWAFDMKPLVFREVVNSHQPGVLPNGVPFFAVYHCSRRVLNGARKIKEQKRDWGFIAKWVRSKGIIG